MRSIPSISTKPLLRAKSLLSFLCKSQFSASVLPSSPVVLPSAFPAAAEASMFKQKSSSEESIPAFVRFSTSSEINIDISFLGFLTHSNGFLQVIPSCSSCEITSFTLSGSLFKRLLYLFWNLSMAFLSPPAISLAMPRTLFPIACPFSILFKSSSTSSISNGTNAVFVVAPLSLSFR